MDGPDKIRLRRPGVDPVHAVRPAAGARSGSGDRSRIRAILGRPGLQRAIPVGSTDDAFEHEAERSAERVMRAPAPNDEREEEEEKKAVPASEVRTLRRQEAPAPPTAPPSGEEREPDPAAVSDQPAEPLPEPAEAELEALRGVRMKAAERPAEAIEGTEDSSLGGAVMPGLHARISAPGAGRPLPGDVRQRIEASMPYDFSDVRVHDDERDRLDARALGARAFTYGRHVWLGPGENVANVRLMAHELTHVVQQGAAPAARPAAVRRRTWTPSTSARGPPLPRAPPTGTIRPLAVTTPRVQGLFESVGSLLAPVARLAADVPGFTLLTVFLGRNPITGETVERTATTLARGVLDLVPGGERIYDNLIASGALQRAYEWLSAEWGRVGITWTAIRELFDRAWDALSWSDIFSPSDAWERIRAIFGPPLARLRDFAVAVGRKVLEFVLEGAMTLAGPLASQVMGVFRQASEVFTLIAGDPIAFVGNLVRAVKGGFQQFSANIGAHLQQGLMGWLFGTLGAAGIRLPETLDLRGILSLVLQILGITYANVRRHLVRALGEQRVAILEGTFSLLVTLVRDGPMAAWQQIVGWLGNLRDMVIGQIRDWVVTRVVQAAVTRLVTMFNPAGAVIQAVLAIYNTVVFFIERARQIAEVVQAVLASISNIAHGRLEQAMNFVEQTMARAIPVVISFMAQLLGLGGIADRIREIIRTIQARVDAVIQRLVNWIVERARALIASARQAAANVLQWWRQRLGFRVGGEEHALEFQGEGAAAQLILRSDPEPVSTWLARKRPNATAGDLARLYGEAHMRYGQVERAIDRMKNETGAGTPTDEARGDLQQKLEALKVALAELMEGLRGNDIFDPTVIRPEGTVEELGRKVVAEPLTVHGPEGSAPSAQARHWLAVRQRRHGGSSYYVQGHLLNEQLHGPGNETWNLTPISRDANAQHEAEVESRVKDKVWNRARDERDQNPQGMAVSYSVEAVYEGSKPNLAEMERKVAESPHPVEQQRRMLDVVRAEQKLPVKLVCNAVELTKTGPDQYTRGAAFVTNKEIRNTIPDTVPDLEGAPLPTIVIDEANEEHLRLVVTRPGDAATIVSAVRQQHAKPVRPAFRRFEDVAAIPGLAPESVETLRTHWQRDRVRLYRSA